MKDDLKKREKMEDNFKKDEWKTTSKNERRPKKEIKKWKMTSITILKSQPYLAVT
jgi:hypothetical protein